jgi:hypothetical protein
MRGQLLLIVGGGVPGEGEEHVVERRLTDLDVVDLDAGPVECAHDARGETGRGDDGRLQLPGDAVERDLAVDVRGKRVDGIVGVLPARGEPDREPRAAGLALELGSGPVGDRAAVVDDDDAVGELVGLVEVLGGEQQRDPFARG